MINDPIVDEIHRIREKLLAEHDGDLDKYIDHLIQEQAKDRDRLVSKDQMPPRQRIH
jgi:hypothetical protein